MVTITFHWKEVLIFFCGGFIAPLMLYQSMVWNWDYAIGRSEVYTYMGYFFIATLVSLLLYLKLEYGKETPPGS